MFESLDESGDGTIDAEEFGRLFDSLGAKTSQETLEAIVQSLDKDNSGGIDKEEFLDFFKTHILTDLDHHGIHQLAKDIFVQLDQDGSGEITVNELKTTIDALDADFTMDEIGALVKELDEDDSGSISEHEIVRLLLVKHHHLFEHATLPKLE